MPVVTVRRMSDDKELTYCSPKMTRRQALVNAYEQLRGNYNTWAYPKDPQLETEESSLGRLVMGELVAWKEER